MRSSKNTRKFLASWCSEGLETLYDLTAWEKENIWRVLKEETVSDAPKLNLMIMRARANSQRQYEIYIFETDNVGKNEVSNLFETSPQFIVDFIRKNGSKIYSDYSPNSKKVIQ